MQLPSSSQARSRPRLSCFQWTRRKTSLRRAGLLLCVLLVSAFTAAAQVSVTTYQYSSQRLGVNSSETILTPSNVNSSNFGKLFSRAVDGYVFAQPLYVPNVTIEGVSHNVVYVATEHDGVYAFDADSNTGANASPLWYTSFLSTNVTTVPDTAIGGCQDINPEVGITGTPVIDLSSNTIYLVASTIENGVNTKKLHALNITTGAEKSGSPIVITAQVPSTGPNSSGGYLTFDTTWENQRPGLLLYNGVVYIGFSAHCDYGTWHGWLLGYSTSNLQQTFVTAIAPNGYNGGVWMAGQGLAMDTGSNLFVATGNGTFDTALNPPVDYGDSIIRMDLSKGPTVQDYFTPYDQSTLQGNDTDVGSGGVLVLPSQSGNYPNLLVQAGKAGNIFLLNRDIYAASDTTHSFKNMGHYNASRDDILQELDGAVGGTWSSPIYFNGRVYFWGSGDFLKAFSLSLNSTTGYTELSTSPVDKSSQSFGFPGATPTISANGTSNPVLWALESDAFSDTGPGGEAILRAYNASSISAGELYDSNMSPGRDNPGQAIQFSVPTVANGKVYVGAEGQLSVFGLLGSETQAAAATFSPGGGTYTADQNVTITSSTSNATIYYTTNGATPGAYSTKYTGPVAISAPTTLKAVAVASGYLTSNATSATYNVGIPAPTFKPAPGTYVSGQSVTLSDSTSGATIYYTTNGTTPTTSSTKYTGPISVSSTSTIEAIAAESGLTTSVVAGGAYTIESGAGSSLNFGSGFTTTTGLQFNGSAAWTQSTARLTLTNGGETEAGSVFYTTPVNIQSFTNDFQFQLTNPNADGFTFTIQNTGTTALGEWGGGLGYGPDTPSGSPGIGKSVAIKFDLYSNNGEGPDSTGIYENGASPTTPYVNLVTTPINLHSGDVFAVHMSYNGTTLTMTITDLSTQQSYTPTFTVNIPSYVGGSTALIGFTGGTGGETSTQQILSWTFASAGSGGSSGQAAPVTFKPASGTYTAGQSVTLSDLTSGVTIYYTTNGTTPTTNSTKYTSPISVSSTTTIEAIAAESGLTTSVVADGAYKIEPGASSSLNFGSGFTTTTGLQFNGSAAWTQSTARLTLTNGGETEAGSAFYTTPVNIQSFTNDFQFQLTNPNADGFTFTIQNTGTTALGEWGGGLGYGPDTPSGSPGIGKSVAIKFDLYSNAGEGPDSTGIYENGVSPTTPYVNLVNTPINLHSGDVFAVHMSYNGTTLTMTITDLSTQQSYTPTFTVNIPSYVGGSTALIGFTGGSGGETAIQQILAWTYASP